MIFAHCLQPTPPGYETESAFKGLPCRRFGVMPLSVTRFSSTLCSFGETPFSVSAWWRGFWAISWKSTLLIYIQVVTVEETAAHWHAVTQLVSRALNILNPTYVLFHNTNKLTHVDGTVWRLLRNELIVPIEVKVRKRKTLMGIFMSCLRTLSVNKATAHWHVAQWEQSKRTWVFEQLHQNLK